MSRFLAAFIFTYVVSFILVEWLSGLAMDPQSAAAMNIVIFIGSVIAGMSAEERGKIHDENEDIERRVKEFINGGR